jgi:hypothetical protein
MFCFQLIKYAHSQCIYKDIGNKGFDFYDACGMFSWTPFLPQEVHLLGVVFGFQIK